MIKNLIKKIKNKKAKVLIIGLGYVGWPLFLTAHKKGFNVTGLDINKKLVLKYKKKYKSQKIFYDYEQVNFYYIDIIIIALPTPLKRNIPDLSYLKNTMKLLYPKLSQNTLIVLESTSYPSTTDQVIVSKINKKFKIGENIFVGYSPEREDPGNKNFNIKNIPKIISGKTINCRKLVQEFYSMICDQVVVSSSIEIAEMTKLYENIFRVVNISLANETKEICKKIKIDFHEVLKLASTKPFGFMPFKPGPGAGGHCIPVDPFYFNWFLKRKNIVSNFIETAGKINIRMPKKIFIQIRNIILEKKISKTEKILLLGLSYKKNIADLRNSPSLEIYKYFKKEKFNIDFNDKYVKKIIHNKKSFFSKKFNLLKKYKIIILSTDHDYYKNLQFSGNQLIFDLRDFLIKKKLNIIKL